MLQEIIPFTFEVDTAMVSSSCLWALALYLGLSSLKEWTTEQLYRWFNFAERFLYTDRAEFEKTRPARESQNAFYASLLSIIPFLVLGSLCNWGLKVSLGLSWAVSMGILASIACAIYELGRRDSQAK